MSYVLGVSISNGKKHFSRYQLIIIHSNIRIVSQTAEEILSIGMLENRLDAIATDHLLQQ